MMIITSPNADAQGNLMINYIEEFIKKNKLKNFLFFKSLGSQIYLSLLKIVNGVVGNSSSGISEVPFFGIGTVNIGDRQQGRSTFSSIINCKVSQKIIVKSVNKILKNNFEKKNPSELKIFGDGQTSKKITKKLLSFNFKKYNKKVFYDF
jgi:GDP/UDP-N,N'-diacetylbacillosamine 2-epimerase (hydrolysing)